MRSVSARPQASSPAAALVAAALLAVSLPLATTGNAGAQTLKPNPPHQDCRSLVATVGAERVFWGRFSGTRTPPWGDDGIVERRIEESCYLTAGECRNWLYWRMTEFGLTQDVAVCSRGWRPSW